MTTKDKAIAFDFARGCLHSRIADEAREVVRARQRGYDTRRSEGVLSGLLAGLYFLTGEQLDARGAIFAAAWALGEPVADARAA